MALIALNGMKFFAYHGCSAQEQQKGNHFVVDLEFYTGTELAENMDDLGKTINYQEVYDSVKLEMEKPSKLIEHAARRIINTISSRFHNFRFPVLFMMNACKAFKCIKTNYFPVVIKRLVHPSE